MNDVFKYLTEKEPETMDELTQTQLQEVFDSLTCDKDTIIDVNWLMEMCFELGREKEISYYRKYLQ